MWRPWYTYLEMSSRFDFVTINQKKFLLCFKDWFVGLSTLESFVSYLKNTELPNLKVKCFVLDHISFWYIQVVHARCDNAGNYHNISFILGLPALHKQTGVLIKTLNTSEPGYGKVKGSCVHLKTSNTVFVGYLWQKNCCLEGTYSRVPDAEGRCH